jgi:xylitol oxidase
MRNWAGNVEFSASRREEPTTSSELQALVAREPRIRAVGTAHSFSDVADTTGVHVSVGRLAGDVEIDTDRREVRVPAGLRYGDLARTLHSGGWAVANLASLPHISIAGTVATGTHGSGDRNPTLSAAVRGLDLVTATGDLSRIDARDPAFEGAVVALGALGVVTDVDLAIEPAFDVRQYVFDAVSHAAVLADLDAAFGAAYSVSLFTTWGPDLLGQVWMKRRDDTDGPWPGEGFLDGRLADGPRHPLPGHETIHCTEQGGAVGPWHERLPHFRLEFTPSSGDELQTEYLVPRDDAVPLLRDLESLAPRIHPLLHVSEIRTMAADALWLSGAYGRDTVGIHFTWQQRPEVLDLLPAVDEVLGSRGGRPHWGKMFATEPEELAARYPRFADFAELTRTYDPNGKFRNTLLDSLLNG